MFWWENEFQRVYLLYGMHTVDRKMMSQQFCLVRST